MSVKTYLRKDVQSVKVVASVALLGLTAVVLPRSAHGQIVTLAHQNAVAQVNVGSSGGMFNWVVDGVDQLNQQWFWFRVGNLGPEAAINTISAPVIATPDARTLYTTYNNGAFSVQVDYTLTGGLLGSGVSDIAETIRINNHTGNPLDFHFFQYCDFDLAGTAGGDATLLKFGPNAFYVAQQTEGNIALEEQVNTPAATHGQAGFFPVVLNLLNDPNPTLLNDNPAAGVGDTAYALQWDFILNPGDTFLISKDKRIDLQAIPEPSILALVSLGLAAVASRKRHST